MCVCRDGGGEDVTFRERARVSVSKSPPSRVWSERGGVTKTPHRLAPDPRTVEATHRAQWPLREYPTVPERGPE